MRPIDFPESNIVFNKPDNMTDDECLPLPAYRGDNFINTLWMPNKEDIEAINAGRGIVLSIFGKSMPPVSLHTSDENGNINE